MKKIISIKWFFALCFWISLILVVCVSALAFYYNKTKFITDFALPMAAGIFAFGQLWRQEKQIEFEKEKFIKENYFQLMELLRKVFSFNLSGDFKDIEKLKHEFITGCLNQANYLMLAREKGRVLFGIKAKDLDSIIGNVQNSLKGLIEVMQKTVNKSSVDDKKLFDAHYNKFADDSAILAAFLQKCYSERIAD